MFLDFARMVRVSMFWPFLVFLLFLSLSHYTPNNDYTGPSLSNFLFLFHFHFCCTVSLDDDGISAFPTKHRRLRKTEPNKQTNDDDDDGNLNI
jgi:hypothetical protein